MIYTIYLLTAPNGKKYCGYTSRSLHKRWDNGNGYQKCPLMWKAIQKYGWDNFKKEIILQTENQEEAFAKEIEVIAKLDLQNPEKGYNIDKGGRPHGNGDFLTEEGRRKISEASKRHWADPEYRAHMIEKRKEHPPTRECIEKGIKASAASRRGKTPQNARAVIQLDKNTDLEIATFISATHAAKAIMGEENGCSNILNVCKGKRKTAYGYKWRFKE